MSEETSEASSDEAAPEKSAAEKNKEAGREIIEHIVPFFRERGVQQKCPMCSQEKWVVMAYSDQTPGQGLFPNKEKDLFFNGHLPTYALYCLNCGFVRNHVKSIVDKAADKA